MMVEYWVEPKGTVLMGLSVFNRVLKIPQTVGYDWISCGFLDLNASLEPNKMPRGNKETRGKEDLEKTVQVCH